MAKVKRSVCPASDLLRGEFAGVVFFIQMHFAAVGGLEGNGTDGALVEDFAVLLLYVHLLSLEGLENHITVKTSEKEEMLPFCSYCSAIFLACLDLLVPSLPGVVQAVFLDVLLDVCRAAQGSAFRTAVRGLVGMNAFMSSEAALVG